ncbi:MAG: formylglycine-generating enzyme family protein [Cyanobacteria bacterium P01_F01_bin.143]
MSHQKEFKELKRQIQELESQLKIKTKEIEKKDEEIILLRETFSKRRQNKAKSSPSQLFIEYLSNDVELEMIAIPDGEFLMGSPNRVNYKNSKSEKPQHRVTATGFYMGKYPVTQSQWKAVAFMPKVEIELSFDPSHFRGKDLPVESISWIEAVEFCRRLSKQKGKEYRLPSEAEWEYACRAGTNTTYSFGDTITDKLVNYNTHIGKPTVVGQYPPNNFGLYDMHGNVQEFCQDNWHKNYEGAPNNSRPWCLNNDSINSSDEYITLFKSVVLRGGSWTSTSAECRSASRYNVLSGLSMDFLKLENTGFRIACTIPRT